MENAWDLYGPSAVIEKQASDIHRIFDALMNARDEFQQGIEILKFNEKYGITIEKDKVDIIARSGANELFKYKIDPGHRKIEDISYWVEKIREALESSYTINELLNYTDFQPKPKTESEARQCALEMACTIDRYKAFLRYSLPNLRKTASHVVMVDRLAIGLVTSDMIQEPFDERKKEFARRLRSRQYLKTGSIPDGTLIKGNVIISKDDDQKVFEGLIDLEGSITESQRITSLGKEFGEIVEGHPCSGVGATVIHIRETINGLRFVTNSLDPSNLVPVNIAGVI